MSTRINTNITALDAARNLSGSSDMLARNIQRLSTGLRINSAADDAAGLVISKSMTAQTVGLQQATSNANDAVNTIKTAEGAMSQVQSLLMSMRQLAVHASNTGANTTSDVAADQAQIASALSSIDRISSTTQFADKKLLDGSATSAVTTTSGKASVGTGANYQIVAQGAWSASTAAVYTSATLSQTTPATVTFATGHFAGALSTPLTASNTTFGGAISIDGNNYSLAQSTPEDLTTFNATIATSGYQASIDGTGQLVFTSSHSGALGTAPSIDLSKLTISSAAASTDPSPPTSFFGTVTFAGLSPTSDFLPVTNGVTASTPITVSGTLSLSNGTGFAKTYKPGTAIGDVQKDLDATFGAGVVEIDVDNTGALMFSDFGTLTDTGSTLKAYNAAAIPTPGTFVDGSQPTLTLTDSGSHTITSTSTTSQGGTNYYDFGNGLVVSSAVGSSNTGTTSLTGSLTSTAGTSTTGTDLQFQIGANAGQTAAQSIGSVATDQLGKNTTSYTDASGNSQSPWATTLKDIDVTTFKGAQDAIAVIDKAISDISTARANLGAFQSNTLESTTQTLQIATQNVQASLSTVQDTNLSSEIVDYTKNQILVQAGTSALAQANQSTQSLLKLLQ